MFQEINVEVVKTPTLSIERPTSNEKKLSVPPAQKQLSASAGIECAVAMDAGYIIAGDKALTSVQSYMAIAILNPKDFLKVHENLKR